MSELAEGDARSPHSSRPFAQAINVMDKMACEIDFESAVDSVRTVALELLCCETVTVFLVVEAARELW